MKNSDDFSNINIEIVGISNLGQGFGIDFQNHQKIYISKTVSGDLVKAKITRKNSKFTAADLIEVIQPSSFRKIPPCPYFIKCGGCALQHLEDQYYQNYKQKNLGDSLKILNFEKEINWVWIGENSRRRAVFHINAENQLGFFKEASNQVVHISHCLMLEPQLSDLIIPLNNFLSNLPSGLVLEIAANLADNGVELIFYLQKSSQLIDNQLINFAKDQQIIRLSRKVDQQLKIIYQTEIPQLFYNETIIELPPQIFLQATRHGQKAIIELINNFIKSRPKIKSVVDLYCGIGTYSFALPAYIKVDGFEGDKIMAGQINKNAAKNFQQDFICAFKRDLFLNPLNIEELKKYDLAIINPPRNGASPQVSVLAKSSIKFIIMVSCNAQSFVKDASILQNFGYKITQLTAIDQFYYTSHLELVAIFAK